MRAGHPGEQLVWCPKCNAGPDRGCTDPVPGKWPRRRPVTTHEERTAVARRVFGGANDAEATK